jgi:membrane-associated phospholipid phosphatase
MSVSSQHEQSSASVGNGWSWTRETVEWHAWWRAAPRGRKISPALGVLAFWSAHAALGGFRADHVALGLAVLAFAYAGPRAAPWFRLLLPLALMGAVYDGQGYLRRALAERLTIHVAEPAAFDRAVFGVRTAAGVMTPAEWWQLHTHPALDVICGATYLGFLPAFIGVALWFRWRALRTPGADGVRVAREAETMTWAFFWLGLISVVTYYLYAAAAPWYAAKYGLGPVVRDALPDAGGAARVDAMLGRPVFATFYGRNPNVFGAIPSLHAAIPLLAFCFAWRVGSLRMVTGIYALLMAFAAVYLNHHYVLDVLWGWAYVGVVVGGMVRWTARRRPTADR